MAQRADVTMALCEWIADCDSASIPQAVREEGVRTFVNWLGCAVGGARHETVDRVIQGVRPFSGPAVASILGRDERLDVLHAALVNGISSHVLDYDDTHLKTIIHPAGPVASALLAVAESRPVSGPAFLDALIIGMEVECRIGNALYPDHYDVGWHITGTTGVLGAAAAVGKLLGLDARRQSWAMGIAATQSSGFREMFGTMCKSFHPGRAAQNGAMAAFLAEAGFDSSDRALEAPRGLANVMSTKQDYGEILDTLGQEWETALNSYKPFACGIVIHPTIDACIQMREDLGDDVARIASVDVIAHPLVLELTGKTEPRTGLEGKFSVFHAAACALVRGDGAPTAFTEEAVTHPDLVALRRKVHVTSDPACHEASVDVTVTLDDGRRLHKVVERAIGSRERPLSNSNIERKFRGQADLVMGATAAQSLLELAWTVADMDRVDPVARAARVLDGAEAVAVAS